MKNRPMPVVNKYASYVNNEDVIYSEPEWKINDIKWLWEDDYYDGPISGMIEYHGKRYYASWFAGKAQMVAANEYYKEEHEVIWRVYCVYKLTRERQEYEEYWHELFELLKVDHKSVDDPALKFFYGRQKADYEPLDLKSGKDGEVVGWFME